MPVVPRQLGIISEAIQSRLSTASVGLFGTSTSAPVATSSAVLPSIPTAPTTTMPVVPRQLGIISEAIQSRLSTASVGLFGTSTSAPVATSSAVLPSIPTVPTLSTVTETAVVSSPTPVASSTPIVSPTVSVITFTTTTSTPVSSTTPAVASSSAISSSSVPSLSLTTPAASTPRVSNAPTSTRITSSPSASATGAASNSGSSTQDSGMGGGIIALIVVGALLAALLAGAFTFRRIQVHRRAKRRENNYGAGAISDSAPFPFTNVSETDLKGAQPVRDFRRQGSITSQHEKPLPSILPDPYPVPVNANSTFGQPTFGNSGMTGPYPGMGAASYGYGPNRTASPAPSQAPRGMSPAPPAAAYLRTGSPAPSYPNPYQQAPALPPVALAPTAALNVPQASGKKRVIQTFQPTLPDELDIRDGDWVTVIHAYDDGWGLCECNGRRGVVPLECLDPGKPDFRASRRFSSLSAIRQ